MHFSGFSLVGPVTLKKLVRASVQVFSGRTTKPVWFLKLWLGYGFLASPLWPI
jgi:hypothetical protein